MGNFYGFKNNKTGFFKKHYRTVRHKQKTAVFLTEKNAASALEMQEFKGEYKVSKMAIFED